MHKGRVPAQLLKCRQGRQLTSGMGSQMGSARRLPAHRALTQVLQQCVGLAQGFPSAFTPHRGEVFVAARQGRVGGYLHDRSKHWTGARAQAALSACTHSLCFAGAFLAAPCLGASLLAAWMAVALRRWASAGAAAAASASKMSAAGRRI